MPEHDAPQSRNEAILQNILGEHNELLEPQSRNEAILQAILYGDSYTEDAQSRIETLLLCILNGTTTDLQPLSRNEEILIAKINGGTYDKEPQSRIEELLIEWLNAFVEKTVTGAVCSFDDAIAGQPFISLSAEITPQQSGSGDPSPSNVRPISGWTGVNVVRCGSNFANTTFSHTGVIDDNGTVSSYDTRLWTDYCPIKANAQFTAKVVGTSSQSEEIYFNRFILYDSAKRFLSRVMVPSVSKSNYTYTITDERACYIVFDLRTSGLTTEISASDISGLYLSFGSTAQEVPPTAPTTYSVTWQTEAGTVYGGYIDLTTGLLTVTWAMADMGDLDWRYNSTAEYPLFYCGVTGDNIDYTNAGIVVKSELYKGIESATGYYFQHTDFNEKIGAIKNQVANFRIAVQDSSVTSLSAFETKVTGKKLIYKLATPQTYQLTPTEVLALLGVNNIYSNTGNTTVKYKARG